MAGDADFDKVALLLHMDGANGSTTFTDNSPGSKIVTAYGGARISTAQSKFGGASAVFDGISDYLSAPAHADFDFGTGDFTLEAWVFQAASSEYSAIICRQQYVGAEGLFQLRLNYGKPEFVFCANSSYSLVTLSAAQSIAANTWTHIALSRLGGIGRLFVDGVLADTKSMAGTLNVAGRPLTIGVLNAGDSTDLLAFFSGHIDDVRITKGLARYTADFTPPTEPFPNASAAYALSGTVTGSTGSPVARAIRAIREDTGAYVGGVISDATTGAYTISTEHPGAHSLIAYPAAGEDLPALVHHGVIPI